MTMPTASEAPTTHESVRSGSSASGLATAGQVKRAALAAFAVAGVVGGALALAVGPELFVVGAASIVAGWAYTGGPRPYGYLGLGEVFVFVFFGLVATVGSTYVQTEQVTGLALFASIPVGLLAVALLVINNLRDIPGDTESGKQTVAVRLGDARTRSLYVALFVAAGAFVIACAAIRPTALIALAALVMAVAPVSRFDPERGTGADPRAGTHGSGANGDRAAASPLDWRSAPERSRERFSAQLARKSCR